MTPDERAVAALARALDAVPNIVTSGWGYTPDEHLAECRKLAPDIWNAIDRDALRAALLADVRKEAAEPGGDMQAALLRHVNRTLTPEAAEDILAAVLRLLGDHEDPR